MHTTYSSNFLLLALLSANWQQRFYLATILKILRQRKVRGSHLAITRTQFTSNACCILCCIRSAYWILVNLSSGGSVLGVISTNLFLSRSITTMASWRCGFLFATLLLYRKCILRTLLTGTVSEAETFSSWRAYTAVASIVWTYMTTIKTFPMKGECTTPSDIDCWSQHRHQ